MRTQAQYNDRTDSVVKAVNLGDHTAIVFGSDAIWLDGIEFTVPESICFLKCVLTGMVNAKFGAETVVRYGKYSCTSFSTNRDEYVSGTGICVIAIEPEGFIQILNIDVCWFNDAIYWMVALKRCLDNI